MSDFPNVIKALAGFNPEVRERPQQNEYARFVEQAIAAKQRLIIEGPTGVGKSLAYLAPSILSGQQVIVATANIALQEQLVTKDLPTLKKVLPPFKFALRKGLSNYLCRYKLAAMQRKKHKDEAERKILRWSATTRTGDSSELEFDIQQHWGHFSMSGHECPKRKCPSFGDCYYRLSGEQAKNAQVIVTNYHFLIHALMSLQSPLPHPEILILDEFHKLPDIARDLYGFEIGPWSLYSIASWLQDPLKSRLQAAAAQLFDESRRLYETKHSPYILRDPAQLPGLMTIIEAVERANDYYTKLRADSEPERRMRGLRGVARCEHLIAHLHDLNNLPDDHVHYAEEDTLNSQLLDPSRALRGFFKAADCVIATSATLAVDGNAFHIVEETGFEPDVGHAVGSPFDYTKQALLVVPDTMPEPNAPTFLEQLKLHVERIVNQARGRTLVLCTSYRAVHYLKEHLDVPYPVLYQGDLPRMRLLERFGQDISSVLVGTESFWGGVDIPGESLSCVVIDRLPFQSPADPVVAELSRRNEDFFWQVSVPRAVLSFRQGFGRLIRRTTDKGVVVVLDRRIATKSYGFSFTGSLPPMGRTSSIEEIGRFLDGDPT